MQTPGDDLTAPLESPKAESLKPACVWSQTPTLKAAPAIIIALLPAKEHFLPAALAGTVTRPPHAGQEQRARGHRWRRIMSVLLPPTSRLSSTHSRSGDHGTILKAARLGWFSFENPHVISKGEEGQLTKAIKNQCLHTHSSGTSEEITPYV